MNKNYLGCFQYKKKWYVITETEIVEVAEEPAHNERKRLDNFWVTRKWLPTEVSKNIKNGNLELLDAALKDTELASLSKSELRILRNMIYAKHGYKFKSQDLLDFFLQFEWYKPRYSNVDAMLSKTDLKNVERIILYEQFSGNVALSEKDLIGGAWQDMPIMAAGWSDTFIFQKGGKIQFQVSQMNEDEYFRGYEGNYKIEKSFLFVNVTTIYINENGEKKAIHLLVPHELNYPISGFEKGKEVIAGYRKNSIVIGNVEFFQFEDEMPTKNW